MASPDHTPVVKQTAKAKAQIAELDFDAGREFWLRVFGLLFDPTVDGQLETEWPFPWVFTMYHDDLFRITFRRHANGDINLLEVEEL